MAVPVRVPERHRPVMTMLARLDEDATDRLLEAATGTSALADRIHRVLNDVPGHANPDRVLGAIAALHELMDARGWSQSDLVQGVASFPELDLDNDEVALLEQRLNRLLNIETLRTYTRAIRVFHDHRNGYLGSSTFVEMRPIFDGGADVEPSSAVIYHTLCIESALGQGNESIRISLSGSEVRQLISTLERSIEKERSLRAALESSDWTVVDVEGNSDGESD